MSRPKRDLLDRALRLGVKVAVRAVSKDLPPEIREPARKLAEEVLGEQASKLKDKARGGVAKLRERMRKKKADAPPFEPSLEELQLATACRVLGLSMPTVLDEEFLARAREARRELLKKYHPDVNKSAEAPAQYETVNRAFELLEKRAAVKEEM